MQMQKQKINHQETTHMEVQKTLMMVIKGRIRFMFEMDFIDITCKKDKIFWGYEIL